MSDIDIDIVLKVDTAICVGSGASASTMGIDKLTLKDPSDNLLIPATTFKGRLRSRCERILSSVLEEEQICQAPDPDNMCPHYFLKRDKGESYCPICQIFGSPWKESALKFGDLVWESRDLEGLNTDVRPGIAVSRRRGVAEEQRLFFIETSPPNAQPEFKGKITGELGEEKQIALLLLGLKDIRALGGGKSRGLGWCSVSFTLKKPKELSAEEITEAMKGWKNGQET